MPEERVFIKTRAALKTMQSLDRIRDEAIIGMVIGEAGRGKTYGIKAWLRRQAASFRYFWIEADVLTSPRPILDCFVRALGLGQSSGEASTLYYTKKRIAAALAENPVMAIIGQADMLAMPRSLQMLRCIWDDVSALRDTDQESGFPLALFGTPKLSAGLERDDLAELQQRVHHHAILPPLNRRELETVLQAKWPAYTYSDESISQILRLSQGTFRWVIDIMKIATLLAAKNGRQISPAILETTRRELIGLPEEEAV